MVRSPTLITGLLFLWLVATCTPAAHGGGTHQEQPINEPAPDAANVLPKAVDALSNELLRETVARLTSQKFAERQGAIARLRSVQSGQIPELVAEAGRQGDAEVARVILEILGELYAGDDLTVAASAGESLEAAVTSDRWVISESAAEILDRNWSRRSELTMTELRTLGATFNTADNTNGLPLQNAPNNFPPPPGLFATGADNLQINLNKHWTGGERGISLLLRLADVTVGKALFGGSTATVYLIDGHSLQEQEIVQLRAVFGDRNVVIRGRVCLGIVTRQPQEDQGGCRVSEVRANSSAHSARIQPGDLITHLNNEPIRDFDSLVALLRKHDVGDVVTMKVSRGGILRYGRDLPPALLDDPRFRIPDDLREPKSLTIDVELKGW